jgi:GTP 3',8-cyclase
VAALIDTFGRVATSLRISVTDRCNFRCVYCMPEEGMQWMKRDELLSFEEIARLVRVFASLGISRIRLTGGEPLMRKDLHVLVAQLRQVPGIADIALTTNGYYLKDQARLLKDAGVNRINVSLDSFHPEVFADVARRDAFNQVWAGIEECEGLALTPIKLNVVVVRDVNDGEVLQFAALARTRPFIVRFIEFMPIGLGDGWTMEKVVPSLEIIDRIAGVYPLHPIVGNEHHPADRYRFADGVGEIGVISSVTQPFCTHCDRIRLTSDGKLRTCLFSHRETDLRSLVRTGAGDDQIAGAILGAVRAKEEGHLINRPEFIRPERTMSSIGG